MRRFSRPIKHALLYLIKPLLFLIFAVLGLARRTARHEKPRGLLDHAQVRSILVIRLDQLGDMVNSMTAVEALHERFPAAHIDLLTLPYTAPIPEQFAAVRHVYTLDTNIVRVPSKMLRRDSYAQILRMIATLRGNHYDISISLFGLMGSLWAWISDASQRIGYRGEGYPCMFTDPVPGRRFIRHRHEVYWDLELAGAAGASSDWRYPRLRAPAAPALRMAERLRDLGVGEHHLLIGIHGGAVNGSAKRWPAGHWAALADRLIAERGAQVVLTGSAAERPIADRIRARMRHTPIVLTGETDIDELLGVLSRCDLVISGDSGPLHLAVALGRPTVSLYGPTDPVVYGPTPQPGQPAVVLRRGLKCSPCYNLLAIAECPYGQPSCMIDITVGHVFEAVCGVLDTAQQL